MTEEVGLCRTSSECRKQFFSRRILYGLISGSECYKKIAYKRQYKVIGKPIDHVNDRTVRQSFRKTGFMLRTYDETLQ